MFFTYWGINLVIFIFIFITIFMLGMSLLNPLQNISRLTIIEKCYRLAKYDILCFWLIYIGWLYYKSIDIWINDFFYLKKKFIVNSLSAIFLLLSFSLFTFAFLCHINLIEVVCWILAIFFFCCFIFLRFKIFSISNTEETILDILYFIFFVIIYMTIIEINITDFEIFATISINSFMGTILLGILFPIILQLLFTLNITSFFYSLYFYLYNLFDKFHFYNLFYGIDYNSNYIFLNKAKVFLEEERYEILGSNLLDSHPCCNVNILCRFLGNTEEKTNFYKVIFDNGFSYMNKLVYLPFLKYINKFLTSEKKNSCKKCMTNYFFITNNQDFNIQSCQTVINSLFKTNVNMKNVDFYIKLDEDWEKYLNIYNWDTYNEKVEQLKSNLKVELQHNHDKQILNIHLFNEAEIIAYNFIINNLVEIKNRNRYIFIGLGSANRLIYYMLKKYCSNKDFLVIDKQVNLSFLDYEKNIIKDEIQYFIRREKHEFFDGDLVIVSLGNDLLNYKISNAVLELCKEINLKNYYIFYKTKESILKKQEQISPFGEMKYIYDVDNSLMNYHLQSIKKLLKNNN